MNSKPILPTLPISSYQSFAFFAVFLTGFCALCSQVIWQKYLAILTGSEARSLSLVVAIFLLGLASGYYVFGLLTESKNHSRFLLLKYYGYVELLTGTYIGFFPYYYLFLQNISFNTPSLLVIDIVISLLALFLPTFLMGASIPMLTAALPDSAKQVNQIHAKVYGWNTLGACLGALVSGFYLIPKFGLPLSLTLIAILNVIASLFFIGNKLEGDIVKKEKPQSLDSPFPNSLLFVFVFIAGSLTISFEILFIRVLNLSIGAGAYNFPIILSIFIGALAYGSLSLSSKKKPSVSFFIYHLFLILLFLQAIFITAPYWSSWLNHIRVTLTTLPVTYSIWLVYVFLFLILFLFPPVFLMGRLLPLSYMFLQKTEKNYGKVCGFLYFSNTLGTVFGAVVMGYLAFYFFDLDTIFKINLYIFFLLTMALVFIHKSKLNFFILSVIALGLLFQSNKWDRSGHEVGLFRTQTFIPNFHFKSFFSFPKQQKNREVAFFKDGPNTTVTLLKYKLKTKPEVHSQLTDLFVLDKDSPLFTYSIIVNGKSDGNTLGDFSTTFFMLPYLYSAKKEELATAFIGLGTGISAGAYTPLEDVKSIDVLEISPFVIKAVQSINPKFNFNVIKDKKVKIIESDAFKYFTKSKKKYDVIVSEPSNPWVMGVENLYTTDFYKLVKESLYKDGVFAQWLHVYNLSNSILEIASKTLFDVFPHVVLYRVGEGDILFVASSSPLNKLSQDKFKQPFVKKFYSALGAYQVEDLYLSQLLNEEELRQTAILSAEYMNTLSFPKIIYKANKTFFLNTSANMFGMSYKPHHLNTQTQTNKMKAFDRLKTKDWKTRCLNLAGFSFLCRTVFGFTQTYNQLQKSKDDLQRFKVYLELRKNGLIPYNRQTVTQFIEQSIQNKQANQLPLVINELLYNGEYQLIQKTIDTLKKEKLINKKQEKNFQKTIQFATKSHNVLKKAKK